MLRYQATNARNGAAGDVSEDMGVLLPHLPYLPYLPYRPALQISVKQALYKSNQADHLSGVTLSGTEPKVITLSNVEHLLFTVLIPPPIRKISTKIQLLLESVVATI